MKRYNMPHRSRVVGVFFLGHASFDHMTAVGRVVFFLQALTSFLARQGA